jgi:two-component system LytT family response regulator
MLDPASVTWIESEDNYVHVHTRRSDYLLRRTLQDLLTQLGEDRFRRIQRCRAVNIAEIEKLSPLPHGDAEITLHGGVRLRMSRRFRQALLSGCRDTRGPVIRQARLHKAGPNHDESTQVKGRIELSP